MTRKSGTPNSERFDADYYRKFYETPATAILAREAMINEVAFVVAFCNHIGLTIARFADVGAGTGWWAKEFELQYGSSAHIETYDASSASCELYGHRRVPLQRLGGRPADLVVCRDVLRYLSDTDAATGIKRLAGKCRGVMYLHVVTREDDFDRDASDTEGVFRPASWYTGRLHAAGFLDCGMGLFVSRRFRAFDPWSIEVRRR
jgi:hypothetical protein